MRASTSLLAGCIGIALGLSSALADGSGGYVGNIVDYGSYLSGDPHGGDPNDWDLPSRTLGPPDGAFAWTEGGSNMVPWILYDLGGTVIAGEARVWADDPLGDRTDLALYVSGQPHTDYHDATPVGRFPQGSGERVLQFDALSFRYVHLIHTQAGPSDQTGVDALMIVPEPTALALLVLGALATMRRRRP